MSPQKTLAARRRARERKHRNFVRNYYGPFQHDHAEDTVRSGSCLGLGNFNYLAESTTGSGPGFVISQEHLCRPDTKIVAAHAVARGMGAGKGDWSVLVTMCWELHNWYDVHCGSVALFLEKTGLDMMAIAYWLARESVMRAIQDGMPEEEAESLFTASYIGEWAVRNPENLTR